MKTTSLAVVLALTLAFVRPAFAQHVIGNIYPDSTDSQESAAARDSGNSPDFGPYSLSEPDLAPAPRDVYSEPAPRTGSLSEGFVAPELSGGAWMQRPEGAFAQPWINPSTSAAVPMQESLPAYSPRAGTFTPFH